MTKIKIFRLINSNTSLNSFILKIFYQNLKKAIYTSVLYETLKNFKNQLLYSSFKL